MMHVEVKTHFVEVSKVEEQSLIGGDESASSCTIVWLFALLLAALTVFASFAFWVKAGGETLLAR
jgi:hypothetical protein